MTSSVHDNTERHRFELVEQGFTVFADYRLEGDVVVVPHVETPVALRGQGAAGRLMTGVMEMIRSRGQSIAPLCPYARAFLDRHPEYADLVSR
jgi:predicted GNAT family acetyltransferase